MKVLPSNVKMHNNYAMELKGIGRIEEARRHYKVGGYRTHLAPCNQCLPEHYFLAEKQLLVHSFHCTTVYASLLWFGVVAAGNGD